MNKVIACSLWLMFLLNVAFADEEDIDTDSSKENHAVPISDIRRAAQFMYNDVSEAYDDVSRILEIERFDEATVFLQQHLANYSDDAGAFSRGTIKMIGDIVMNGLEDAPECEMSKDFDWTDTSSSLDKLKNDFEDALHNDIHCITQSLRSLRRISKRLMNKVRSGIHEADVVIVMWKIVFASHHFNKSLAIIQSAIEQMPAP